MNFKKQFSHSLVSQYGTESGMSVSDFLPTAISYSAEAAEHLIYLKSVGDFNLPAGTSYNRRISIPIFYFLTPPERQN